MRKMLAEEKGNFRRHKTTAYGICCNCGYDGSKETICKKRADKTHCEHWWDGPERTYPPCPDTKILLPEDMKLRTALIFAPEGVKYKKEIFRLITALIKAVRADERERAAKLCEDATGSDIGARYAAAIRKGKGR